jgi:hypothetical protein
MDHSEATDLKAAERYILGDLSVSEAEDFERHFFGCPQCSEELRALAIFQDNARAVFLAPREETARAAAVVQIDEPVLQSSPAKPAPLRPANGGSAGWRRIFSPWSLAPALGLSAAALVIGWFVGFRSGHERPPQSITAFPLYAAARGEETVVAPPHGAEFYTVYLDRTWDRDFASYRAVVREERGGREEFSAPVDLPRGAQTVYILIPARVLSAGRHVLTISGVDGPGRETEAARCPFNLKID